MSGKQSVDGLIWPSNRAPPRPPEPPEFGSVGLVLEGVPEAPPAPETLRHALGASDRTRRVIGPVRVSGFGFRVSGFGLRVSGFLFERLMTCESLGEYALREALQRKAVLHPCKDAVGWREQRRHPSLPRLHGLEFGV